MSYWISLGFVWAMLPFALFNIRRSRALRLEAEALLAHSLTTNQIMNRAAEAALDHDEGAYNRARADLMIHLATSPVTKDIA